MRVLMLAQFYPPVIGGEERHLISLSEALVARGHEVTVATMPHPDRAPVVNINGVAVHSLQGAFQRAAVLFSETERPHAPPFPDPELTWRLGRLAAQFKPDVVHGHNWMIHQYLPLKLTSNAKLVATLHDYSLACSIKTMINDGAYCSGPEWKKCLSCAGQHFGPVKGQLTAAAHFATKPLLMRSVDNFIAVSHAVAEKCGVVAGPTPYSVIPTFIPDDLGAPENLDDPRVKDLPPEGYLLYVGELNRNKGVHVLLEAYKRLKGAPPLVLIGRRCTTTPEHLPENVFMFESWPHKAVMHAWSKCLFGLAPSTFIEPCGTVVMEANCLGKTMVAANHGGLAELVSHGVSGMHVVPGDVGGLAETMQQLIDNPNLRKRLEVGALERAETFKAKSVVPKIESIYGSPNKLRQPERGAAPVTTHAPQGS
jgi:glycosyltransferase involved in cell wall biosynthesis